MGGVDEHPVAARAEEDVEVLEVVVDDALVRHVEAAQRPRGQRAFARIDAVDRRGMHVAIVADVERVAETVVDLARVASRIHSQHASDVVQQIHCALVAADVHRIVASVGGDRGYAAMRGQHVELIGARAQRHPQILYALVGDAVVLVLIFG